MKTFVDNIKPILGMTIVVMTYVIFIICLFMFREDINVISQIIIAVVGGFGVATGYYFGYSQGASKKDDKISDLTNNNPIAKTESGDILVDSKPKEETK